MSSGLKWMNKINCKTTVNIPLYTEYNFTIGNNFPIRGRLRNRLPLEKGSRASIVLTGVTWHGVSKGGKISGVLLYKKIMFSTWPIKKVKI